MIRPLLKSTGLVVLVVLTAAGLTQDRPDRIRPTYFGIKDGEVPEDPREWREGRYDDFPDWDVNAELPNDVFTFARLRYNSGTWMGQRAKWLIDYPDSELNFSYRLQQLTSLQVDP